MNEITPNDNELSIKDLILKLKDWGTYLLTKWIYIGIVGTLGGAIGFYYASTQPTTYTAKMTFVMEEGKAGSQGLGGLASLAGQFGVDVGGGAGGTILSGDNILLYFKSPSLIKEVLLSNYDINTNQSIADVYSKAYRLNESWEKDKSIRKVDFKNLENSKKSWRLEDSIMQKMIEIILTSQFNVTRKDKKASFIDVTTTMVDETLSKTFCERIVETVVKRYVSLKVQRQQASVDKLQKRVDSISNLLNIKTIRSAALQNSSSTMDINPLYKTGSNVSIETNVREKTLLSTIFASVIQNLEISKFNLSQETPVIQIIDTPTFPLKKVKMSRLRTSFSFFIISTICFLVLLIIRRIYRISFN